MLLERRALKVGAEMVKSRVATVPLGPGEVGRVPPLPELLGGVDRPRSLLSNPQVLARCIATADRVRGYAIASPRQDRKDIVGIRLALGPEMLCAAGPGAAAVLAQDQALGHP